jgi:hypothetical protein
MGEVGQSFKLITHVSAARTFHDERLLYLKELTCPVRATENFSVYRT